MKSVLVIKSHTRENSFCNSLADEFIRGAEDSKREVKILNLAHLDLEKFIKCRHEDLKLAEELSEVRELITWSDHLAFAYPIWWASPPALLKVFFEIVFYPEFAFKFQESEGNTMKWDKLLVGKSARIIATMDTPPLIFRWLLGDPNLKMMKSTLGFCGIKPIDKHYFGPIKTSSAQQRKKWLEEIYKIGNLAS